MDGVDYVSSTGKVFPYIIGMPPYSKYQTMPRGPAILTYVLTCQLVTNINCVGARFCVLVHKRDWGLTGVPKKLFLLATVSSCVGAEGR